MKSVPHARGPWSVLIVIALITALCAVGVTKLRVANDPQEFLPDHPTVRLFREIERDFGVASFSHVIAVRFAPRENFTIESPEAILEMEAVLQALRAVPGILSAQGIPDFVKFVRAELHGGDRRFYSLPTDGDELGYSFAEIIRMTFQRMALLKKFTSLAGTALATATIAKDADIIAVSRHALAALKPIQERAVALEIGLVSYGETLDVFNQVTQRDIRYVTPLVFAVIALTLLWVFRLTRPWELGSVFLLIAGVALGAFSPELFSGAALPVDLLLTGALALLVLVTYKPLASLYLTLGVVGLSGVWAFGLLGFLGVPVNFLMAAVFPLLMGIGDDYAIHLLHRYEEERCKKQPGPQAIQVALTCTGRAIALTTITTAIGFTALFFAPSPPIRWFGLLSAVSVISALLITMTLIPALKQIFPEGPRTEPWSSARRIFAHPQASLLSLGLGRYAQLLSKRAVMTAVLLLGLLLGAFGYWEGRAFQTYTVDYRRLLPQDYPAVVLYTQVNQEFRTYDEVQLVLTGEIARLEVMRVLLKDIPEALAASPYAHTVTSIAHYLEDVRAANSQLAQGFLDRFVSDPDGAYRWLLGEVLAKDSLRQRAEAYIGAHPSPVFTDGRGVALGQGEGRSKALVRVNTMRFADQEGVRRVVRDISERLAPVMAKLKDLRIEAQLTGIPFVEELGLNALHQSLTQSLVISFALCLVVMALALRSIVWGLIGLFPMIVVTGLLLGTVSLLKLELNAATAIVAALSIGLGVDYAIHLIHRFREERDVARATARTGEALFAAFFTTASAFFVLMLSTITWNRDFGLLVGLAVFYAFVVTVFVLPALISFISHRAHYQGG